MVSNYDGNFSSDNNSRWKKGLFEALKQNVAFI